MTETTTDELEGDFRNQRTVELLKDYPPAPPSAFQPGDWHDVPKGFYAIPTWDWMKFGDDCVPDGPAPVAELLGYRLFVRKVTRTYKTGKHAGKTVGTDELKVGKRVVAAGVRAYVVPYTIDGYELRYTAWDRLTREMDSDKYVCQHEARFDGDPEPPCNCFSCKAEPDRQYRAHWKAVPNQREAYINHVAAMILDGIAEHDDVFRRLYGVLTGSCGICGAVLTDPTSKLLGIGPDCGGRR